MYMKTKYIKRTRCPVSTSLVGILCQLKKNHNIIGKDKSFSIESVYLGMAPSPTGNISHPISEHAMELTAIRRHKT